MRRFLLTYILLIVFVDLISAQVIDYSKVITIDDNEKTTLTSVTINVTNQVNRSAGDVSIRISNGTTFKLIKAEVIDNNDKVVNKIKKKDIKQSSLRTENTFYQDDKLITFNLQWNKFPYQIKYTYEEKTTEFISIANWYPDLFFNTLTLNSSLELRIPLDYQINFYSTPELNFTIDTLNEKIRKLKWSKSFSTIPTKENYSPPTEEISSHVYIMPHKFKYKVKGESTSWATYGNWFEELNNRLDSLPKTEKDVIDKILQTTSDKRLIIQKLYEYVQSNTNYINVSIGYGGLASYPAEYVSKNKYGDCKALTTYLKALLNYAGIQSYYTLINSGIDEAKIIKQVPGPQFNHVILSVPLNNDTLFLENTSKYLPYNYINTYNQNRTALLINGLNSQLITIPAHTSDNTINNRTMKFSIVTNGDNYLETTSKLRGKAFEQFLYYKNMYNTKKQKSAISKFLNINSLNIEKLDINIDSKKDHYATIEASGTTTSIIKNISKLKLIKIQHVELPKFEAPENRNQAIRFSLPIIKADSLIYDYHDLHMYKVNLPENISINSKYGSFQFNIEAEKNLIRASRKLIIHKGDIKLEEYNTFYEFINEIDQSQSNLQILLEPLKTK